MNKGFLRFCPGCTVWPKNLYFQRPAYTADWINFHVEYIIYESYFWTGIYFTLSFNALNIFTYVKNASVNVLIL